MPHLRSETLFFLGTFLAAIVSTAFLILFLEAGEAHIPKRDDIHAEKSTKGPDETIETYGTSTEIVTTVGAKSLTPMPNTTHGKTGVITVPITNPSQPSINPYFPNMTYRAHNNARLSHGYGSFIVPGRDSTRVKRSIENMTMKPLATKNLRYRKMIKNAAIKPVIVKDLKYRRIAKKITINPEEMKNRVYRKFFNNVALKSKVTKDGKHRSIVKNASNKPELMKDLKYRRMFKNVSIKPALMKDLKYRSMFKNVALKAKFRKGLNNMRIGQNVTIKSNVPKTLQQKKIVKNMTIQHEVKKELNNKKIPKWVSKVAKIYWSEDNVKELAKMGSMIQLRMTVLDDAVKQNRTQMDSAVNHTKYTKGKINGPRLLPTMVKDLCSIKNVISTALKQLEKEDVKAQSDYRMRSVLIDVPKSPVISISNLTIKSKGSFITMTTKRLSSPTWLRKTYSHYWKPHEHNLDHLRSMWQELVQKLHNVMKHMHVCKDTE